MKNLSHIFIIILLAASSLKTYGITQLNKKFKSFHLSDIIGNTEQVQVIVSPFIKQEGSQLRALDSFRWTSLEDSIANFHRLNLPHYVSTEKILSPNLQQNLGAFGVQKIKYQHKVKDHYFCEGETVAFQFADGKISIKLNTLKITDHKTPDLHWDHYQDFSTLNLKIDLSSECVFNKNGKLIEAWKLNYYENGFPFEIIVDSQNQILKKQNKFLNINATIQSYLRNEIEDEDTLTDQVVDVDPDFEGFLVNENFSSKPVGETPVSNDDFEYIYNPVTESRSFEEATAFLYANVHLEYFEDNGYLWQGPRPMTVAIHSVFGVEEIINNASYKPGSQTDDGRPEIAIGDGDGEILKDLALDRDVISHELGHHAVFRSITQFNGDPVVLHEAFADYFALDSTGNSCLGESICADPRSAIQNGFCWVGANSNLYDTQCLRSAETDLTMTIANQIGLAAHFKSQVLSGMLWDLRRSESDTRVPGIPGHGLDPAEIRPIVHNAIDFLTFNSGFRDFIIALLEADRAINGGSIISAKIYQAAINRGLSSYMTGIDCTDTSCDLENLPAISSNTDSSTISQGVFEEKNESSCGTVSEASVGQFNFTFLLIFLIPLFITIFSKRQN